MKQYWNQERLKKHYCRILENAKKLGFSDEDLDSPYLNKLFHQTKSKYTMKMIELAYYLGKLKGVAEIDEGYTPVTLD